MIAPVDGIIIGYISNELLELSSVLNNAEEVIEGAISTEEEVIEGNIISINDIDVYDGSYIVIPQRIPQELDTRQDLMRDNLIVKEVPYYEVSNPYGTTVNIGG